MTSDIGITSVSSGSNDRVLTSNGGTTATAESNLTFNGSTLSITGALTATGNAKLGDAISDAHTITGSLGISGSLSLTPALPVASGGTGKTSLTNNRVLTGNGTGAIVDEANLTFDGTVLSVGGTFSIDPGSGTGTITLQRSSNDLLISNGDIGTVFQLTDGGNIIIAGTLTQNGSPSDSRFKDNVSTITGSLQKVNDLSGYTFQWNSSSFSPNKSGAGVIAGEVEAVLPEIVYQIRKDGEQYSAVDYNGLVALLIEAVKELSSEVTALKEQINGNP